MRGWLRRACGPPCLGMGIHLTKAWCLKSHLAEAWWLESLLERPVATYSREGSSKGDPYAGVAVTERKP